MEASLDANLPGMFDSAPTANVLADASLRATAVTSAVSYIKAAGNTHGYSIHPGSRHSLGKSRLSG